MNDGIFHERLAYQKPVLLNIYIYIYIYIFIHIYIAYLYSIFIPHIFCFKNILNSQCLVFNGNIQRVLKIKWMSF